MIAHKLPSPTEFRKLLGAALGPEVGFLWVIVIYSAAISLLSLAIPISVQLLIDTVANTGMLSAVVTLGLVLFGLLVISGVLYALRAWCMELFNRRLFSRLTSEISMVGLMSPAGWFEQASHRALFNRFFDIMTVKKNTPYLLSQCFTLLFQSILGFVVVSLYHSYFLVFSLVLICLIWLVWKLWGWKATEAAFELSEVKHETAYWLQHMATNNDFLKTSDLHLYALKTTNESIGHFLSAQQKHFRYSYAQLISFLMLYAMASAALLGIGGWLVLQGQMTLGQLVSAELILSAIFYGLPQLSGYLDYYYDLCAAVEELSRFKHVDQEGDHGLEPVNASTGQLVAEDLEFTIESLPVAVNLDIPPGTLVRFHCNGKVCSTEVGKILAREEQSTSGTLRLGELDLLDCPLPLLRKSLVLLSRVKLLSMSIRSYLQLANHDCTEGTIRKLLAETGLMDIVGKLPAGMDTVLAPEGQPLTVEQTVRLRLAFALLSAPAIIVLDEVCDSLHEDVRKRMLQMFLAKGCIVLYGGNAPLETGYSVLELDIRTGTQNAERLM